MKKLIAPFLLLSCLAVLLAAPVVASCPTPDATLKLYNQTGSSKSVTVTRPCGDESTVTVPHGGGFIPVPVGLSETVTVEWSGGSSDVTISQDPTSYTIQ